MGAAPEIYFALFSETPILSLMLAIRERQCKKPSFPAVLGIFADRKTKAGFTPYPTQKKMIYIYIYQEQNRVLNNLIFSMMPQDHARYFVHPRE